MNPDPSSPKPKAPPPKYRLQVNIDDQTAAGTFANFVNIWHDNDTFVLDFSVTVRPPSTEADSTGQEYLRVPVKVVARLRFPPTQVWELIKGLEQELSAWELWHGQADSERPATRP